MRVLVAPEQAGLRLDQLVASATGWSRRAARRLIAAGEVRRNGQPTRVQARRVERGDVIELTDAEGGPETTSPAPEVALLHRDPWLIAVDKPAGVLSQPAERRAAGELAMDERLLLWLTAEQGCRPFLRLVHRLDRVTSGVLLFAAAREALAPLATLWKEGVVERHYLAVVEGDPPFEDTEVEAPIAHAAGRAWRFEVAAAGRPARTRVTVRQRWAGGALVECLLSTGRTHQVRVHLAHLGLPVRGDRLYGAVGEAPRPLLHAERLALPHPRSGERLTLVAPLPADLRRACRDRLG